MKEISIIVCCYNSATRIEETLRHIFSLAIPDGLTCEVILVNNNSKDNTREIAIKTYKSFRDITIPLRIFDESQAGLSFARTRGVKESICDTVLFCDDDNHLTANYLVEAKSVLDEYGDTVGIVGGLANPKFSIKTGSWVEDFYPSFAIGPQAEAEGFVPWVYGAGMIVRKKVFIDLENRKIKLLLSDRMGSRQTSGGDAEICQLTNYLGYRIYYTPRLMLFHAIAQHRLSRKAIMQANYRNVYPIVHLYLLQSLIANRASNVGKLYASFWRKSFGNVFYFMPRSLIGKHRFYSFLMLYQNVQLTFWILLNRSRFVQTYFRIKNNLT